MLFFRTSSSATPPIILWILLARSHLFFSSSFHPSYPLYVFIQVQSNPNRCDCLALIDFQSKEEEGASCSNPEQESDSARTLYNKH